MLFGSATDEDCWYWSRRQQKTRTAGIAVGDGNGGRKRAVAASPAGGGASRPELGREGDNGPPPAGEGAFRPVEWLPAWARRPRLAAKWLLRAAGVGDIIGIRMLAHFLSGGVDIAGICLQRSGSRITMSHAERLRPIGSAPGPDLPEPGHQPGFSSPAGSL